MPRTKHILLHTIRAVALGLLLVGTTTIGLDVITTPAQAARHWVDTEQRTCDARGQCRIGYQCEVGSNLCKSIAECREAADCDDGSFCNGAESCGRDGMCVAGAVPCEIGCIEAEARCKSADEICPDRDGDGQRDASCGGRDCDDTDPDRFPGNTEICDAAGKDEDCNPRTAGFRDRDGDGFNDWLCTTGWHE